MNQPARGGGGTTENTDESEDDDSSIPSSIADTVSGARDLLPGRDDDQEDEEESNESDARETTRQVEREAYERVSSDDSESESASEEESSEEPDRRSPTREVEREAVEQTPEPAPESEEDSAEEESGIRDRAADIRDRVEDVARDPRGAADDVVESVRDASETASETADEVRDRVEEIDLAEARRQRRENQDPFAEQVGDRVGGVVEETGSALQPAAEDAARQGLAANRLVQVAGETVDESLRGPTRQFDPNAPYQGPRPEDEITDVQEQVAEEFDVETEQVLVDYDANSGEITPRLRSDARQEQLTEEILEERPVLEEDDIEFSFEDGELVAETPPDFDSRFDTLERVRIDQWQRGQQVDEFRSETFGVDAAEEFEEEGARPENARELAGNIVQGAIEGPQVGDPETGETEDMELITGVAPAGTGRARGVEVGTRELAGIAGLAGLTAGAESTRRTASEEESVWIAEEIEVDEDGGLNTPEVELDESDLGQRVSELGVEEGIQQAREIATPERLNRIESEIRVEEVEETERSDPETIQTAELINRSDVVEREEELEERRQQEELNEREETEIITEDDLVDPEELRQREMEELGRQVEEQAQFARSTPEQIEQEELFWQPDGSTLEPEIDQGLLEPELDATPNNSFGNEQQFRAALERPASPADERAQVRTELNRSAGIGSDTDVRTDVGLGQRQGTDLGVGLSEGFGTAEASEFGPAYQYEQLPEEMFFEAEEQSSRRPFSRLEIDPPEGEADSDPLFGEEAERTEGWRNPIERLGEESPFGETIDPDGDDDPEQWRWF